MQLKFRGQFLNDQIVWQILSGLPLRANRKAIALFHEIEGTAYIGGNEIRVPNLVKNLSIITLRADLYIWN